MRDITIHIITVCDGYVAKVTGCPIDLHAKWISSLMTKVDREVLRQKREWEAGNG